MTLQQQAIWGPREDTDVAFWLRPATFYMRVDSLFRELSDDRLVRIPVRVPA